MPLLRSANIMLERKHARGTASLYLVSPKVFIHTALHNCERFDTGFFCDGALKGGTLDALRKTKFCFNAEAADTIQSHLTPLLGTVLPALNIKHIP